MEELRSMSEEVVGHLLLIRNQLYEMDLVHSRTLFIRICERVRLFLKQHALKLRSRPLTSVLFELTINRDLDSFQYTLDTWEDTRNEITHDVENNLVSIGNENDANSQFDLPTNETRSIELENSLSQSQEAVPEAAEIVEVAVETEERMSNGATERKPARFIAEQEFQRDPEPLSSGSLSKGYRGIWCGATVVIKYVEVKTKEDMRSFLQEDKIWHMARHPNVVTYYGCHLPQPCFLVSEEALNGSSINFIAKEKERKRSVMWGLIHGAALGLVFLHGHMIIHGDLARRNILVDANGVAKLGDFGMSSLNGYIPTAYAGPVQWTAPECVVRNQAPSIQSDTYSLGMCIIEAATGRDPWGSLSDIEVYYILDRQEFLTQPAELNDDQWRLVTSLCAFEPNQRCSLDEAVTQLKLFANAEANALQALSRFRHSSI